jgi:hypothetical protein
MSDKEEPAADSGEQQQAEQAANATTDTTKGQAVEAVHRAPQGQAPTDHNAHDNKLTGWASMSWTDRAGFIFDGLVALTTVVTLIFLIAQWRQTNAALGEAKEANRLTKVSQAKADADGKAQDARNERMIAAFESLAGATKDSAASAKDSAEASRDTASAATAQAGAARDQARATAEATARAATAYEREQRPRARLLAFEALTRRPGPFKVRYHYFNDGKRDAERFLSRTTMFVRATVPPRPAWTSRDLPTTNQTTLEAGVKGRYSETQNQPISNANDLLAYDDGKARLYIWLRLDYSSNGRHYWLETCQSQLKTDSSDVFQSCGSGTATQGPEEGEPEN